MHFFGRAICHQLEERSLFVDGKPLSVCARCTGIYIGIFSTLLYLHLFKRKRAITIPTIKMSFFLLLLTVPLMIDGLGSYFILFDSNNLRRLITGIIFGFTLPYFIYPLLFTKIFERTTQQVILQSKDLYIPIIFCITIGGAAFLGSLPYFVLNSFIVTTIIIWFSLFSSFAYTIVHIINFRWVLSVTTSVIFISILSLLHQIIAP